MALKYKCRYCGSDNITQNAEVSPYCGEVVSYFDDFMCHACGKHAKECDAEEAPDLPDPFNVYSVLLLYPDYMSDNYGQDTYFGCAEAATSAEAIRLARVQAAEDNGWEVPDDLGSLDDLFCLLCIEGQHTDINPGT